LAFRFRSLLIGRQKGLIRPSQIKTALPLEEKLNGLSVSRHRAYPVLIGRSTR
jgi:hypothetical protein